MAKIVILCYAFYIDRGKKYVKQKHKLSETYSTKLTCTVNFDGGQR